MLRLAGRALVRGGGSAPLSTSAARCLAAASNGEGQVDGVLRSFPEMLRALFGSAPISRSSSSATAGPGSASQADGGPDAAGAAAAAADGGVTAEGGEAEGAETRAETEPASAGQEDEQEVAAALQEKTVQLTEAQKQIEEMGRKIEGLASDLRYTLADMENLRKRTQAQMESTQKYAVQGFAKSMLDVADNLERAIGAVPPEEELASAAGGDAEAQEAKVRQHLTGLLEGVKMTERVLQQALQQHGVVKMEAQDQVFDPNLHNALFEVPDPTRAGGIIATVAKTGYMLRDRVLRAADVGVAKSLE